MKKLTMIIAVVAIGFVMASCNNKEKALMQQATEFYTQAETELKSIDNLKGFVDFFQNFQQKFDEFKASFSDMQLSEKTQNFLSEKENAFNEMQSQKADELFSTYLEPFEEFVDMYNEIETTPEEEITEEQAAKMDSWEQETKPKVEALLAEFEGWNLDKDIFHDILEKTLPAETMERFNKVSEFMDRLEEVPNTEEAAQ